jgi:hypothetical protein
MRIFTGVLLGLVFFGTGSAMADDFDGSKPFLCALMTSFECDQSNGCVQGTADDINAPRFVEVDMPKKRIVSRLKEERTTEILSRTHIDGSVVLQGVQRGLGWSMSINETSGDMVLTASGPDAGFVVTGACTPLAKMASSYK